MRRPGRTIVYTVFGLVAVSAWRSAPEWAATAGVPDRERLELPADGIVRGDRPVVIDLPTASVRTAYSITVVLRSPDKATWGLCVPVRLRRGDEVLSQKVLHNGDPDLFVLARGDGASGRVLEIGDAGAIAPFEAVVRTVQLEDPKASRESAAPRATVIETEPNDRPEDAVAFELGQTVFASADDRPYISAPGEDEAVSKAAGEDWYNSR